MRRHKSSKLKTKMMSDAIKHRGEPWDLDAAEVPLPDGFASPGSGRLFVGSLSAAVNPRFYRDCGVGRVLTVAAGMDDASVPEGRGDDGPEIERLIVKIHDHPMADILKVLPRCLRFIHGGLEDGRGVLVHCASGVSRSVTVCATYLMFAARTQSHEIKASEAIASVAAARKYANPNLGFRRQLDMLERRVAFDSAEEGGGTGGREGGPLESFIAIVEEAQKVFAKTRVNVVEDAIRQRDAANGLHARADALEGELAALKSEGGGGGTDSEGVGGGRRRIRRDLLLLSDELDACLPLDDPPARMIRRAAASKVERLLDDLSD